MDAIILVGGQGLRLRPLTASRHKSLVPVCNRPAIEYLFDWLRDSGFTRVVLALGQGNDDLARAYPAGEALGFELLHVFERERLESGGAIRNAVAEAEIEDTFVVLNGDVYLDFSLSEAIATHRSTAAELTIALTPVEDPSSFGVAVVDESRRVTGFVEKPPRDEAPSNLVNAGLWIFERSLVEEIPAGAVRVEETLFPSLVEHRRAVLGYVFDGLWADIGTLERYLGLNLALLGRHGGRVIGNGADVADTALVEDSVIGDRTTVAGRATVRESITWERCVIGEGAEVVRSVLADGVTIGAGARIEGAALGKGASVAAGSVVPPGSVVETGTRYDAAHGK